MTSGGDRRRRKRHERSHENLDRWLLTYADMITLLLALFMMLYALSNTNTSKTQSLIESLQQAFNSNKPTAAAGALDNKDTRPSISQNLSRHLLSSGVDLMQFRRQVEALQAQERQRGALEQVQRRIERFADRHGLRQEVEVTSDERGMVIRLISDKVLFETGKADIRPEFAPALRHIAKVILPLPNQIRVEGHTDSVPISTGRFPSNWELSSARASAVVRYLIRQGVAGSRFSAAGYADRRPLASNASERGRMRNRRVEIVILNATVTPRTS